MGDIRHILYNKCKQYIGWLSEETLGLSEFDVDKMNQKKRIPMMFKRAYEDAIYAV